jgi:DNA-binding transcriptional LysR family regulator
LNIGACTFTGRYIFPKIIADFKKECFETEISLEISKCPIIIEHILRGSLHFGWICCSSASIKDKDLVVEEFGKESLSLIAPANYSKANNEKISLSNLTEEKFIMMDKDCGIRLTFEEYLQRNNRKLEDLNVIMTVGDNEAIKKVVGESMGLAIVPKRTIVKEIASGVLNEIKLKEGKLWQKYWLIYNLKRIAKTSEINHFLNFLKSRNL